MIRWTDSPECLMQCAGPLPLDEEQLARHLQGNGGEEPERINFKAIDTDTGEMMVHIEWNRIDWNNGSTTLSRVLLDPSRRGEGLGTAMVS